MNIISKKLSSTDQKQSFVSHATCPMSLHAQHSRGIKTAHIYIPTTQSTQNQPKVQLATYLGRGDEFSCKEEFVCCFCADQLAHQEAPVLGNSCKKKKRKNTQKV